MFAAVSVLLCAGVNSSPPHIALIIADDLGFADLGYTGSEIKTPVIDNLVSEGAVLGHYYVNICCSPTRAMLMTGRYDVRFGLQTQVIPSNKKYGLRLNETTLGDRMQARGYSTHALGKWHLGEWRYDYTPTFRGFESFLGYYGGSQDYFTHKDMGYDFHLDVGKNCGEGCSRDVSKQYMGNYSTLVYAKRAETVIAAHAAEMAMATPLTPAKPLFMYLALQSVHAPIEVPDSYVEPYANLSITRRKFAGMVAAMDECVGRVVAALDKAQMLATTAIFFTTDNGGPVGALNGHPRGIGGATGSQNWPLRGGKGAYFQGGVRGTAWVHGAFLHSSLVGQTTNALMHAVDLHATIVALAGGTSRMSTALRVAEAAHVEDFPLDGVSQLKVFRDGAKDSAREDLLVNIERHNPTTAPSSGGECNGPGQYVAILGWHKIIIGGGGLPNTWYHDGLPFNGTEPTPSGGCLTACNATGCAAVPALQIFDLEHDEEERVNLAEQTDDKTVMLIETLLGVVDKYNRSAYVDALFFHRNTTHDCPFNNENGVLTPCPLNASATELYVHHS
tara:strand:+ start:103 stop:1785 length:1683 start_codon:yes stop_codon:yes gene_type:complete